MAIRNTKDGILATVGNVANQRIGPIKLSRILGLLTALLLWIWVASVFPRNLFPYPLEAISMSSQIVRSGEAWQHLWPTVARTFWGFVGAMFWGIFIGVFMGINDYSRKFYLPYIVVGLSVPGIAWAAITTLIFGLGLLAPVVAVMLTTFPYIAINVWKGVEAIDADLVQMSQSFNVSYRRLVFRLLIPSAAPSLFAAFRFGLAISWKVETNAEVFAASSGIGYKTIFAYQSFNYSLAWAWALLFIVIIIIVEYGVFKPLERRVFEYRQDADLSII
jgi:ABC-type nitrate/sulfonate/bicarbonate transport system permease component